MTKLEIENIHRQATLFLDNAEVSEAFETVGKLSHELSRAAAFHNSALVTSCNRCTPLTINVLSD